MASAFSRTVDVDGPGLHMVAAYDYDYNGDDLVMVIKMMVMMIMMMMNVMDVLVVIVPTGLDDNNHDRQSLVMMKFCQ